MTRGEALDELLAAVSEAARQDPGLTFVTAAELAAAEHPSAYAVLRQRTRTMETLE